MSPPRPESAAGDARPRTPSATFAGQRASFSALRRSLEKGNRTSSMFAARPGEEAGSSAIDASDLVKAPISLGMSPSAAAADLPAADEPVEEPIDEPVFVETSSAHAYIPTPNEGAAPVLPPVETSPLHTPSFKEAESITPDPEARSTVDTADAGVPTDAAADASAPADTATDARGAEEPLGETRGAASASGPTDPSDEARMDSATGQDAPHHTTETRVSENAAASADVPQPAASTEPAPALVGADTSAPVPPPAEAEAEADVREDAAAPPADAPAEATSDAPAESAADAPPTEASAETAASALASDAPLAPHDAEAPEDESGPSVVETDAAGADAALAPAPASTSRVTPVLPDAERVAPPAVEGAPDAEAAAAVHPADTDAAYVPRPHAEPAHDVAPVPADPETDADADVSTTTAPDAVGSPPLLSPPMLPSGLMPRRTSQRSASTSSDLGTPAAALPTMPYTRPGSGASAPIVEPTMPWHTSAASSAASSPRVADVPAAEPAVVPPAPVSVPAPAPAPAPAPDAAWRPNVWKFGTSRERPKPSAPTAYAGRADARETLFDVGDDAAKDDDEDADAHESAAPSRAPARLLDELLRGPPTNPGAAANWVRPIHWGESLPARPGAPAEPRTPFASLLADMTSARLQIEDAVGAAMHELRQVSRSRSAPRSTRGNMSLPM